MHPLHVAQPPKVAAELLAGFLPSFTRVIGGPGVDTLALEATGLRRVGEVRCATARDISCTGRPADALNCRRQRVECYGTGR